GTAGLPARVGRPVGGHPPPGRLVGGHSPPGRRGRPSTRRRTRRGRLTAPRRGQEDGRPDMTASLYITGMGPESGQSLVALGLMETLAGKAQRAGFFRPVAAGEDESDPQVVLI